MVLNVSSLSNEKDGLGNLFNLTSQDFYVRLVDEKNKENNSVLAGRTFPSCAHFDFPPFLRPATQANNLIEPNQTRTVLYLCHTQYF